jgi:hypothetical protein
MALFPYSLMHCNRYCDAFMAESGCNGGGGGSGYYVWHRGFITPKQSLFWSPPLKRIGGHAAASFIAPQRLMARKVICMVIWPNHSFPTANRLLRCMYACGGGIALSPLRSSRLNQVK